MKNRAAYRCRTCGNRFRRIKNALNHVTVHGEGPDAVVDIKKRKEKRSA